MKSFLTVNKPSLAKALLVMRLTTVFILSIVMQVSARGFGQEKLNLHFKKAEIAGVLTAIEKQTHYRFLYNDKLQSIRQKVSCSFEDANIKEALDFIFANTMLTYQFMANNLIVV